MLRDLALSLVTSLFEHGAGRLRDWAFGDAETRALRRAWEAAFETMLARVAEGRDKQDEGRDKQDQGRDKQDQETLNLLEGIFTDFIRANGVADLLLDLALSDGEPPLTELAARFDALGFDRETLPVDFRAALEALMRGLGDALVQEAGEPNSPLYNRVSLGRLFVLQALLLRERETLEAITAILHRWETQGGRTIYNIIIQQARGIAIGDGAQVLTGLDDELREATMEAVLQTYRAHLHHIYAELNLGGLRLPFVNGSPLDPKLIHIPLDRVYIKLHARPWSSGRNRPKDKQALAEYIRHLHKYKEWLRAWEGDTQIVDLEEAIQQHDQVVILGPPGAGKSTFLQHVAWTEAKDGGLPLLVPLGRMDTVVEGGRDVLEAALDTMLEAFIPHKVEEGEKAPLKEALKRQIDAKRTYWLWDALDEVHKQRQRIEETLENLVDKGHRIILTSRPLSYTSIAAGITVYEVLPLREQDARDFVGHWFGALAEAKGEEEGWAEERQQWMERQLAERPGLREVARNPLMLTFLAVLAGDDPRQNFPRRRKDLYARFVERLITSWEVWKRGGEEAPLLSGFNDPDEAKEVALFGFRRIAWHLHLAYTEEVVQAMHKAMKEALAKGLQAELDIRRLKAQGLAEKLLNFWQRAGLLDTYTLRGVDYLAFRHLTFQEYGAACALAETYGDDPEALWMVLEPHLLEEDDWAEVIPLTLAHLKDATPLVERMLEANAKDEALQRPLFRAAAALAEGANLAEGVRRRMIDELAHLIYTRHWKTEEGRATAADAMLALGRLEDDEYVVEILLALAQGKVIKEAKVRERSADVLAQLGRTKEAVQGWLAIAQDGEMEIEARKHAVRELGKIHRINELLALAQERKMEIDVRMEAANALGECEEAEQAWLTIARDVIVEAGARVEAASALSKLGCVDKATTILFNLGWDETVGADVRIRAAEELNALKHVEEATSILIALLQNGVDADMREDAAMALRRLGRVEEASSVLLILSQDEKVETGIRVQAAKALNAWKRIEEAAQAWLAIAQDEVVEAYVREEAAEALGKQGHIEEASPILLALARDGDVKTDIRVQAANALDAWGRINEAVQAWLALAQDDAVEVDVRVQAAKKLEKLESIVDEATRAWLAIATDGQVKAEVRMQAAEALGEHMEAAQAWLAIAQDKAVEAYVREEAAEALGRQGHIEEAAPILLALARDGDVKTDIRVQAVNALDAWGRINEAAQAWLAIAKDWKVDKNLRMEAAEVLGELGRIEEAAPILLTLARDEAVEARVGVEATAALAELGRVEELLILARDSAVKAKVRVAAAEASSELGRIEEAASVLLALAQDGVVDADERVDAAEALGRLGRTKEAVETLTELGYIKGLLALAQDELVEAKDRVQAAIALAELSQVEEAAEVLLDLAQDEVVEVKVRVRAAKALADLGRIEEAAQAWFAIAHDNTVDERRRVGAIEALADLSCVKELLALAQDEMVEVEMRKRAAETLVELGRVEEIIPSLREIAQNEVDDSLRAWAEELLYRLEDQS